MKISTYHRNLGDNVRFFKGNLKDQVIDILWEEYLNQLNFIDNTTKWEHKQSIINIKQFIKSPKNDLLDSLQIQNSIYGALVENCLRSYADSFRKKQWIKKPKFDRIYITTLFTFY